MCDSVFQKSPNVSFAGITNHKELLQSFTNEMKKQTDSLVFCDNNPRKT